jgi:hypothetical protein
MDTSRWCATFNRGAGASGQIRPLVAPSPSYVALSVVGRPSSSRLVVWSSRLPDRRSLGIPGPLVRWLISGVVRHHTCSLWVRSTVDLRVVSNRAVDRSVAPPLVVRERATVPRKQCFTSTVRPRRSISVSPCCRVAIAVIMYRAEAAGPDIWFRLCERLGDGRRVGRSAGRSAVSASPRSGILLTRFSHLVAINRRFAPMQLRDAQT